MPIDYTEILDTPSSVERAVRKPGDFKRKGQDGPPYVKSATGTRKRPGKKADLLAAARAEGHDQVDETWTVPQLHELLGREPSWELYGRPSGYGDEIDNMFNLMKHHERELAFGLIRYGTGVDDSIGMIQRWRELDMPRYYHEVADDPEARRLLDRIAVNARQAAGSDMAAARGTWVHALTEVAESGGSCPQPDPSFGITDQEMVDIAQGWLDLLDTNGLNVHAAELPVVNDALRLAGTLDRLVELTEPLTFGDVTIPAGTVLVLDIKGLALDTKIPTPDGWTTIGQIQVGDQVIGSNGEPCTVTAKSAVRERPCYRIKFDDGTEVVADDEHRWAVRTGEYAPFVDQVLTTKEIADSIFGRRGQRQHRVLNARPVLLPNRLDLPVEPYLFGLWLGDGIASGGRICKPVDSGIWEELRLRGHELKPASIDKRTGCATVTVVGLRTQLRLAGLLGDKRVPDEYMRASESQRLELLRGLMDSDGTWNKARHRATFTSTDKALSLAVYELVVSLGERAHLSETLRTGFGVTVTAHDVEWAPLIYNPFAESGKRDRANVRSTGSNFRRLIVSAEEIPTVPTQCIAVDSPDHTYLCTESMVPTHNTSKLHGDADGIPSYWASFPLQVYAYATAQPYRIEGHWDADTGEWVCTDERRITWDEVAA